MIMSEEMVLENDMKERYVKIIDNFLPEPLLSGLLDYIYEAQPFSKRMPFSFTENDIITKGSVTYTLKESLQLPEPVVDDKFVQFVHTVYNKFGFAPDTHMVLLDLIDYIEYKLSSEILITLKINITLPEQTSRIAAFHTDANYENTPNHKTAVLFLNNTDGDIILENGTRVECVENRLVVIDGSTLHSGTTCTNSNKRTTLNFNYIGKDL